MFYEASGFDQDIGRWDVSEGREFVSNEEQYLSPQPLIFYVEFANVNNTLITLHICYGLHIRIICSKKPQFLTRILEIGMCQRAPTL